MDVRRAGGISNSTGVRKTSATNQRRLRDLFRKLDHQADSMDLILKKRSDFLVIKTRYPLFTRMPFSDSEVERLLLHTDEPNVQLVLFFLYTGFRNNEGCNILKKNVNLANMTITGGAKTPSGTGRIIPIHPRIRPFVESWMQGPSKYLLTAQRGGKMYAVKLEEVFKKVSSLYCDRMHIPHECRHTLQHSSELGASQSGKTQRSFLGLLYTKQVFIVNRLEKQIVHLFMTLKCKTKFHSRRVRVEVSVTGNST